MAKPRPRSARQQRSLERTRERKRKRSVIVFGIIMIFLMVFSVASYIGTNPQGSSDLTYGDFAFRYDTRGDGSGVLLTEINGRTIEFQNLPVQVQHLPVDSSAIAAMQAAPQIVMSASPALDPQEGATVDYARFQLALAIPKMASAMSEPDERFSLPVLNCSHASPEMPVLLFAVSNATPSLENNANCLVLSGEQRAILQLKDRIIFEYYGILENGTVVE